MPKETMPAEGPISEQEQEKQKIDGSQLAEQTKGMPVPLEGEGGIVGGVERLEKELFEIRLVQAKEECSSQEQMGSLENLEDELEEQMKKIKEAKELIVNAELKKSNELKQNYQQAKTLYEEKKEAVDALGRRVFQEEMLKHVERYNLIIEFLMDEFKDNPDSEIKELIFKKLLDIKQSLKDPNNLKKVRDWCEWTKIYGLIIEVGTKEDAPQQIRTTAAEWLKKDWQNFKETSRLLRPESDLPIEEKRSIARRKIIDEETEHLGLLCNYHFLDVKQKSDLLKFYIEQVSDPKQDEKIRRSLGRYLVFLMPSIDKSDGLVLFNLAIEALGAIRTKDERVDSFLNEYARIHKFSAYLYDYSFESMIEQTQLSKQEKREKMDEYQRAVEILENAKKIIGFFRDSEKVIDKECDIEKLNSGFEMTITTKDGEQIKLTVKEPEECLKGLLSDRELEELKRIRTKPI